MPNEGYKVFEEHGFWWGNRFLKVSFMYHTIHPLRSIIHIPYNPPLGVYSSMFFRYIHRVVQPSPH